MESLPAYFRYWAKIPKERGFGWDACHLLPYHALDVAATGKYLLDSDEELLERFSAAVQMAPDVFRRLLVFSLALHDLGKFARSFQSLAAIDGVDLVEPDPRYVYRSRHDALALAYWKHYGQECLRNPETGNEWLDAPSELTGRQSLAFWLSVAFGHHGKPVDMEKAALDLAFSPEDKAAAWGFVEDAAALLEPSFPHAQLSDKHWRDHVLKPASWELAGFGVLADWLGSDQSVFGHRAESMPLATYWHEYALPGAEQVVERSGLRGHKEMVAFPGFSQMFGFEPAPLQSWAESVPLADGPQLFLLEDITGAGKTEAALTLAHRLLAAGHRNGVYFALPTQATSNAMYTRVGAVYRDFYSRDSQPSLVLAHGARQLRDDFTRSILPEMAPDTPYTPDDEGGLAQCSQWLADSRKKALLADVGVGTVDQALLGVLPRRHQSLRLLGLARKVLVVDEVHAYDTYTGTLLERLLEAHARHGGSAILLSATIPQSMRRRFLEAWQRGREGGQALQPASEAFPLATHLYSEGLDETPVAARTSSERDLPVDFVHSEEEALSRVVEAARSGRCACWIRNTVDDAIGAYQALRESLPEPDKALLFHARFTMGDRQRIENDALRLFGKESGNAERAGRVLIATQVVEQSLDLDFDVLVSDLAPVELLIQRAGRLYRHARTPDGDLLLSGTDQRESPVFHVHAPEWNDEPDAEWVRRALIGTSYVYPDFGMLWLTMRVLRERGAIRLPAEARLLLEAVYAPEVDVPEGLQRASDEALAEQLSHRSMAGFNVLDLSKGYSGKSVEGGWSDDEEIGTRLSDEPSVQVVLVRVDENQRVKPWNSDTAHPWAMSTVQLRKSQADRLPSLPEELGHEIELLREEVRSLRYARFWLPADERAANHAAYDSLLGAVIPRKGGEQEASTVGTVPHSGSSSNENEEH
ncbi:CRISPR-associated helicase Cas3 [Halorhodospira halochloris]|uniref:CRISPR-associated helicase Cas3 n=1 Tax=Halorhodospira halochloris TaxID=1052 RepID=A0A0X8X8G9_HALHR|nr:CRISPR-associated helicase/endonuclease Cas3 [Halorhodospira halochloris]MBK1651140.1 CRISPR-associated helicase/endonuclease Cas3 [Halorhodospira halochloris]BAU57409.1 CRISPR-associated helicase Cas3 [Halorhodospira halochloris]